jgi:hypothetical protein
MRWSDAPGCFERHLQRRFMNPLFPRDRRNISSYELADAQARDAADLANFLREFESLLNRASSGGHDGAVSAVLKLRDDTEELMVRAARVGAPARKQGASLQELYEAIANSLRSACSPTELAKLEEGLRTSARYQETATHEFLAQLSRSDGPISGDEVLPSMLSEDVEAVRLAVRVFSEPLLLTMRKQTKELLAEARAEGFVLPDEAEKLSAIGALGASE